MRCLYLILTLLGALLYASAVRAQENNEQPARRTPQATRGSRAETNANATGLPGLTVRAQDMNERMTLDVDNARWIRVLYRELDVTKEENAPLYYPVHPLNGSKNLFTIIFELMSEGKLKAYKYEDGYEAFDENHLINFKEDVLDRAYIYYEEAPGKAGQPPSYVINENDIPSEEIRTYYIKEAWYFDQHNSVFDVKTLAICPIITTMGDFGEQRTPLFWLPYENIRPYIHTAYIMTSNINNAKNFTIDDYFRRRMFKGEIIKAENLMNKTLRESYPEPDSLKTAQEAIEKQLMAFEQSLWFQPDTTAQAAGVKSSKKADKQTSVRGSSSRKEKETTQKTPSPKAEKSAPVRSVRRTR